MRVNSNEKWTGMKNTGLKMPEKDQIYVLVGFHTIRESKLAAIVLFNVLNVSELIRGLTRARNLKKQCNYM